MPNTELFNDLAKHYTMNPPADWSPEVCVRGVLLDWDLIRWTDVDDMHLQMAQLLEISPTQVNLMVYGVFWEDPIKNRDIVVNMLRRAGADGKVVWWRDKVLEVA